MAHKNLEPTLTAGNVVFLYGLLKDSIGTGKQTFLTHVEAALEEQRMTADDLGFPSTQALLEALGDCVKLTIFKGGRVYATIIEQPEWDAALAATAKGAKQAAPAKGNKPWKRKKGDKTIKPVRPKRVKREVEAEAAASQPEAEAEVAESPAAGAGASAAAIDAAPAIEDERADASVATVEQAGAESEDGAQSPADEPELAEDQHEEEPSIEDAPSIAVTVTYDPYTGIEEETVIKATPGAFVPAQEDVFIGQQAACAAPQKRAPEEAEAPEKARAPRDAASAPFAPGPNGTPAAAAPAPFASGPNGTRPAPEAAPAPAAAPAPFAPGPNGTPAAPAPAPAPAPAKPALPDGLPVDFATDVYCSSALLHRLTMLYPYGADVLGILTEYFHIACDAGTIRANRRRASFPARYLQDRERKTVLVKLSRRDADTQGHSWVIDDIEEDQAQE